MPNFSWIYSQVPRIACKGLCQACCGPIEADPPEKTHFTAKTGKVIPNKLEVLNSDSLTCPLLNVVGQCSVYQHRPLICRLWGVVDDERMRCPHGCVPDRYLTQKQARELMMEAASE